MDKSIGVLLPVYNGDCLINFRLAWDSIYSLQSRKADEYVVVRDGIVRSELEEFLIEIEKNDDVCVIRLKENQGLPKALNIGISHISSAWVLRADADDINLPFRIQFTYDNLNDSFTILTSPLHEFTNDVSKIESIRECGDSFGFLLQNPVNHPSVVVHKESIIRVGSYRNFKYFEDLDLWIRIVKDGGAIRCLKVPLVKFRMNQAAYARRRGWNYFKEECKFLFSTFRENNISFLQLVARVLVGFIVRNMPLDWYSLLAKKYLRKSVK